MALWGGLSFVIGLELFRGGRPAEVDAGEVPDRVRADQHDEEDVEGDAVAHLAGRDDHRDGERRDRRQHQRGLALQDATAAAPGERAAGEQGGQEEQHHEDVLGQVGVEPGGVAVAGPHRRAEEGVVDVVQRQHDRFSRVAHDPAPGLCGVGGVVGHRERHRRDAVVVAQVRAGAAEPDRSARQLRFPVDGRDPSVVPEQEVRTDLVPGHAEAAPVGVRARARLHAEQRHRGHGHHRPAHQPRLERRQRPPEAAALLADLLGILRAEQQRQSLHHREDERRGQRHRLERRGDREPDAAGAGERQREPAAPHPPGLEQRRERQRQPEDEVDLRQKQRPVFDERKVERREHDGEQPGAAAVRRRAQEAQGEGNQTAEHELQVHHRRQRAPSSAQEREQRRIAERMGDVPGIDRAVHGRELSRQVHVEGHVRGDEVLGPLNVERVDRPQGDADQPDQRHPDQRALQRRGQQRRARALSPHRALRPPGRGRPRTTRPRAR